MNIINHKSHIKALNNALEENNLPFFDSEYLSRDSLVRYCVNHNVSYITESIPVNWLSYEPVDLGLGLFDEDAIVWGHNLKLANIFVEYLSRNSDQVHIISDNFIDEPYDRAISITIADWNKFLSTNEMQFNLAGDILIFDSSYNQILIFFHHSQVHLLSLNSDAKVILTNLQQMCVC